MVYGILFTKQDNEKPVARYVQLANDTEISCNKDIVCCGAHRTPQLMMRSGVGPAARLAKHDIPVVMDHPQVGKKLYDHFA